MLISLLLIFETLGSTPAPEICTESNALGFDGFSSYVSLPAPVNNTFSILTIEARLRFGNLDNGTIYSANAINTEIATMVWEMSGGNMVFYIFGVDAVQFIFVPVPGKTYFLAITYNSVASPPTIDFFLNGELKETHNVSVSLIPVVLTDATLGAAYDNGSYSNNINLDVSEFRIWQTARNGSLDCVAGNEPGLIMAYLFDTCEATFLPDISQNNLDGVLYGTAWQVLPDPSPCITSNQTTIPCSSPNALSFDGIDAYIPIPTFGESFTQLTIELFVQFNSIRGWQAIYDSDNWNPNAIHYLFLDASPNFIVGGLPRQRQFNWQAALKTWYFISVTYEAGVSTNLYVDNVLVDSFPHDGVVVPLNLGPMGFAASINGTVVSRNTEFDVVSFAIWNMTTDGKSSCPIGSEPNLLLLYNLNTCDGVVVDETMQGRNGYIYGATPVSREDIPPLTCVASGRDVNIIR